MASTREIKRRIRGIANIRQITNAMQLVSTAKLRRSRRTLEASRPYYETVFRNIQDLFAMIGDSNTVYQQREIENILYIVFSSDRGLAGGYNTNILRLAEDSMREEAAGYKLVVIGTKAKEYFERRGVDIVQSFTGISEKPTFDHARELTTLARKLYYDGEIDAIDLVYTRFESTIQYTPQVVRILPTKDFDQGDKERQATTMVEFEPNPEEVLSYLIPKYVEGSIFGALIEAAASEQGARRFAMENATDNANEMIEKLETNYNRARQAAITNEITEIVSGADALN